MIPLLEMYKERWNIDSDRSIKPGLASIEHALAVLGNPEKPMKVVHFAGTNGKGSTLTFVEFMAREYGLKVGKFMSPCIKDVHDQIQINGVAILPEQMDAVFKQLADAGLSGKLTDFELLTAAAFLNFAQQQVDLVLLEAGMGGREDSTNVVVPIVSVIPSIALEHTKFLGTTLESIARHKAGIIKRGKPAVIGQMPQEALRVFEQEAIDKEAPLFQYGKQFLVQKSALNETETYENLQQRLTISDLTRQLLGAHQGQNMAIAITAFLEVLSVFDLEIDEQKMRAGIHAAKLAGRFEQVLPNIYFDGAHNPASVRTLVDTIKEQFPTKRIEFVIGLLADKDVSSILSLLEEVGDAFYFVDIQNDRAMEATKIFEICNSREKHIVVDVIGLLQLPVKENTVRIVTGSLYLLSEIRRKLQ